MQPFILRGLPSKLARDGWWMNAAQTTATNAHPPTDYVTTHPMRPRDQAIWSLAALLTLLVLADFLFWGREIGISLAAFALVAHICLWTLTRDEATRRSTTYHAAIAVLSVLPSIELVQSLSVMFLIAGLLINAARVALGQEGFEGGLTKAVLRLPLSALWAAPASLRTLEKLHPNNVSIAGFLSKWALPVIGSIIFLSLFAAANPVLENWLGDLFGLFIQLPDGARILFWVMMAMLIWPLLVARKNYSFLSKPLGFGMGVTLPGVNPLSIANALIVFNILMLMQNLIDAATLIGALPLPTDITLSQYVRKGAYTLIATAMLAGGFAILSRPFALERAWLTRLLYVWLLQNAVLVGSGAYRLMLVIEEHGLSHMRIYGGIWMAVVLIGLGLIVWQVRFGQSTNWLWKKNFIMVSGVLYVSCFVNFAHVIAASQVARNTTSWYVCTLGEHAAAALVGNAPHCVTPYQDVTHGPIFNTWFDWGFRDARVRANLAAKEQSRQ